ncbi:HAD family hydrolase [Nocardiopsis suaedae]|uniref:HAD hydrolase-like protein n=1 Tax=Nocardiopsis suaedae TaxID=3018444 RepID=A0ABT4TN73_9ACTN|nr:HAD hydrolase-like protein [Nocardiopsis suaedae]MDA2806140.1 HAD hydrolase-like protein [Nocardiopsis suaedae]
MNASDVETLQRSRYVLLDFDGPVCSAFAGYPAPEAAESLRAAAIGQGVALPESLRSEDDPMKVLLGLWEVAPEYHQDAEALLTSAEVSSVAMATPTAGAIEFMRACASTGRPLAVVSNNSPEAVRSFLDKQDLAHLVKLVIGRDKASPLLMKPDPHLPRLALKALEANPATSILIGDSTTDIEAAHAVGAVAVGYANRPGKRDEFQALSADVITEHMRDLARALTD